MTAKIGMKPSSKRTKTPPLTAVNFRLAGDPEELKWVYAEATAQGLSVNQFLRNLVADARLAGMSNAERAARETRMVDEMRRTQRALLRAVEALDKAIEGR